MLKVSAFYLEKQKSFISKKIFSVKVVNLISTRGEGGAKDYSHPLALPWTKEFLDYAPAQENVTLVYNGRKGGH